ncbi:MAG TPA: DUF881 domain-containing protein [Nocardioides sp.]
MTVSETRGDLPAHVTTPLLTLITARSMDEDYAFVAEQRAAGDRRGPTTGGPSLSTVLAVVFFGLMVAVAAVQTSRNADVTEAGRATLISQIEAERDTLQRLQEEAASLAAANRAAEERLETLRSQQRDLNSVVRRVETRTGHVPVRGPGVRLEIANAPYATETTEIRDEDLATLVDGLWEAGAEAISVNGERLTVLTGIRNTGRAIHIGGTPIRAPYTVLAVGDPGELQARLLETSEGAAWFVLVRSLGFQFAAENAEDLRLPAADLRPARFVESGLVEDDGVDDEEARP